MTARRRRRGVAPTPYRWMQVHTHVWCALGGHGVLAGGWVRYLRNDYRGMASCEDCLKQRGVTRPQPAPRAPRAFTFVDDRAEDVRARQSGDDE